MTLTDFLLQIWLPAGGVAAILWWWRHWQDPTCGGPDCVCFRIALTFFLVVFFPTYFLAQSVCGTSKSPGR